MSQPAAERAAIERWFASVLADRHPGTRWVPVRPGEGDDRLPDEPAAGEVVRRLPAPQDQDPVLDRQRPAAA